MCERLGCFSGQWIPVNALVVGLLFQGGDQPFEDIELSDLLDEVLGLGEFSAATWQIVTAHAC